MSELKAGESIDFAVGDKTLTIGPVPYGNLKKLLRMMLAFSGEAKLTDVKNITDILDKYVAQILPLMFPVGKYDFINEQWIEDTMTVPTMRKMLEAFIVANGLQDFFEQLVGRKLTPASDPRPMTPPEKDGSTISAGSPTDGVLKTLTN